MYHLILISSLFVLTLFPSAHASTVPNAPKIAAEGYLLIEYETDTVLAEKIRGCVLSPPALQKS